MMRSVTIPAFLFLAATAAFGSTIVVTITPSIGPSPTSPSLQAYENNAELSLQAGGNPTEGTANNPSYYAPILSGSINPLGFISTTYPSWMGTVDPAAPYNNETGNAVFFGLTVVATGGTFNIDDISFFLTGNGTVPLGPVQFSTNTVGYNGVSQVTTSGNAATDDAQALTALYTSGIYVNTTATDPSQIQNIIDTELAGKGNVAYYSANVSGSPFIAQVTFDIPDTQVVPEPMSFGLVGLGLAGVYAFRRRLARR